MLFVITFCIVLFVSQAKTDSCFCQLKGDIDDCSCTVESVDSFNNHKVYPRLDNLLHRDYFKYYKTNLFRACPFASQPSGQCDLEAVQLTSVKMSKYQLA